MPHEIDTLNSDDQQTRGSRANPGVPSGIVRHSTCCRAFLAQRRGATHSGEPGKLDRRDGELKMDWTKPLHHAHPMGVEWLTDS